MTAHVWLDVDTRDVSGDPMFRSAALVFLDGHKTLGIVELAQCAHCRLVRIRIQEVRKEFFLTDGVFTIKQWECKKLP